MLSQDADRGLEFVKSPLGVAGCQRCPSKLDVNEALTMADTRRTQSLLGPFQKVKRLGESSLKPANAAHFENRVDNIGFIRVPLPRAASKREVLTGSCVVIVSSRECPEVVVSLSDPRLIAKSLKDGQAATQMLPGLLVASQRLQVHAQTREQTGDSFLVPQSLVDGQSSSVVLARILEVSVFKMAEERPCARELLRIMPLSTVDRCSQPLPTFFRVAAPQPKMGERVTELDAERVVFVGRRRPPVKGASKVVDFSFKQSQPFPRLGPSQSRSHFQSEFQEIQRVRAVSHGRFVKSREFLARELSNDFEHVVAVTSLTVRFPEQEMFIH
jgi:hypothetical protein